MTYLKGKHPFLTLKVKLGNKWETMECLIDTGFSGGLVIPLRLKSYFPENQFVEARFVLADNSEVAADSTIAKVRFEGKEKDVAVVFMDEGDSLVGVEFLDQMIFCLDLKKRKVSLSF